MLVVPMYIPGRSRTCSPPSRTVMSLASYPVEPAFFAAVERAFVVAVERAFVVANEPPIGAAQQPRTRIAGGVRGDSHEPTYLTNRRALRTVFSLPNQAV